MKSKHQRLGQYIYNFIRKDFPYGKVIWIPDEKEMVADKLWEMNSEELLQVVRDWVTGKKEKRKDEN